MDRGPAQICHYVILEEETCWQLWMVARHSCHYLLTYMAGLNKASDFSLATAFCGHACS